MASVILLVVTQGHYSHVWGHQWSCLWSPKVITVMYEGIGDPACGHPRSLQSCMRASVILLVVTQGHYSHVWWHQWSCLWSPKVITVMYDGISDPACGHPRSLQSCMRASVILLVVTQGHYSHVWGHQWSCLWPPKVITVMYEGISDPTCGHPRSLQSCMRASVILLVVTQGHYSHVWGHQWSCLWSPKVINHVWGHQWSCLWSPKVINCYNHVWGHQLFSLWSPKVITGMYDGISDPACGHRRSLQSCMMVSVILLVVTQGHYSHVWWHQWSPVVTEGHYSHVTWVS